MRLTRIIQLNLECVELHISASYTPRVCGTWTQGDIIYGCI
jgi:hypothetical protein